MSLAKLLGSCVALILSSGCTRVAHWNENRWSADSKSPEPLVLSLGRDFSAAELAHQKVELRRQEVAGVPIEGSYVKTLSDGHGRAVWLSGQSLDSSHLPSELVVRQLLGHRARALKASAKLDQKFKCVFSGEAKPELRFSRAWKLAFVRRCEGQGGRLLEIAVDTRGRLLSSRTLGSSFANMTEVAPKIYPRGPKASDLRAVPMHVSINPDYLSNPQVQVISDAGLSFANLNELTSTSPSEDRFDMLEAYYFANHALLWAEKHLGYKAEGFRIRTQVGSPDKLNLAFYFDNEVRLGSGDGVLFNHMAWDPSIVTHETMHSVIDALTHLPLGSGEGGSLQEGLADILTALQLQNPDMGDAAFKPAPFQRTVANVSVLSQRNGGLYHDSLILSGTLWQIHTEVKPADTAEKLTIYLLAHLVPTSGFADVTSIFKTWLTLPENQLVAESSRKILQERGWL